MHETKNRLRITHGEAGLVFTTGETYCSSSAIWWVH